VLPPLVELQQSLRGPTLNTRATRQKMSWVEQWGKSSFMWLYTKA